MEPVELADRRAVLVCGLDLIGSTISQAVHSNIDRWLEFVGTDGGYRKKVDDQRCVSDPLRHRLLKTFAELHCSSYTFKSSGHP